MKETQIQSEILKWLKYRGFFHWRNNNIAVPGRKFNSLYGQPDIIVVLKYGQILGIEVKTPKGKQSQYQKDFEKSLTTHGGIYLLATSLKDVADYFESLDKNINT